MNNRTKKLRLLFLSMSASLTFVAERRQKPPQGSSVHYMSCHLADAFIQSDLQLIRLSRGHTPWSNVGLRAHLADAFIQSDLQLIRLSRRHTPWSNVGVEGLVQGPNSCADLIVATPGIEPPTLRVQVH